MSEEMDRVERTLAFLAERTATHDDQIARAWVAIDNLADKQAKLDDALLTLTEAQIANEERWKQTEERWKQTDERFRQTDERIGKLVSAIGELVRRGDKGEHV
jgi:chromosome segregation ATPase